MITPTPQQIEAFSRAAAQAVAFPPDRVLCRVLDRFKMFVLSSDYALAPHLALDGFWESWITSAFWKIVKPGMHVVNVGANVGYYSLLAAHLVGPDGRVDAFEPNPVLAQLVQDNSLLNGYAKTLRVRPEAVSDRISQATFRVPDSHPMNGSLISKGNGLWKSIEVATITLDYALDGRPDVVFVDAEGAEPLIVQGSSSMLAPGEKAPILVLEWGPVRYLESWNAAKTLLGLGFKVHQVMGDGSERLLTDKEFCDVRDEITIVCRR